MHFSKTGNSRRAIESGARQELVWEDANKLKDDLIDKQILINNEEVEDERWMRTINLLFNL